MRNPIPGTHEPGYVEPPLHQLDRDWRRLGACAIHVSKDGGKLHLSISHPERHPSWDEIKTARYRLLPDALTFAMILPPPEQYVNVPEQDHVFHLWEIEGE